MAPRRSPLDSGSSRTEAPDTRLLIRWSKARKASFVTRLRAAEDERNLSIELTREGRALRAKAEVASSKFVDACALGKAEGGDLRDKLILLTKTLRDADE
jgi:DNA-binding MarR family transcriptional regulator